MSRSLGWRSARPAGQRCCRVLSSNASTISVMPRWSRRVRQVSKLAEHLNERLEVAVVSGGTGGDIAVGVHADPVDVMTGRPRSRSAATRRPKTSAAQEARCWGRQNSDPFAMETVRSSPPSRTPRRDCSGGTPADRPGRTRRAAACVPGQSAALLRTLVHGSELQPELQPRRGGRAHGAGRWDGVRNPQRLRTPHRAA